MLNHFATKQQISKVSEVTMGF